MFQDTNDISMDKPILLLVEDNLDDIALTVRAFRKASTEIELVVVRDGAEALNYLLGPEASGQQRDGQLPTIVLLDLKLPKLNGLEVLRQVRANARTRCLPVIVFTSSREEQDIAAAYAYGANSYLRKPVDFTVFSEMARLLSIYWLQFNEPAPRCGAYS